MTDKNNSLPPEDIARLEGFFRRPEPLKPFDDTSTEFLITLRAGARRVRYAAAALLLAKALYREGMRDRTLEDPEMLIRWADLPPKVVLKVCTQSQEDGLERAFREGLLKVQDSFRVPMAGHESPDELSMGYIEIGDFIAYAKGLGVAVQVVGTEAIARLKEIKFVDVNRPGQFTQTFPAGAIEEAAEAAKDAADRRLERLVGKACVVGKKAKDSGAKDKKQPVGTRREEALKRLTAKDPSIGSLSREGLHKYLTHQDRDQEDRSLFIHARNWINHRGESSVIKRKPLGRPSKSK